MSLIGRLSVAEVNVCLDNLALSNAKKDKGGMKKSLQMLLRNLSALEQVQYRQTEGQTDRQTDRQRDRQTDRQTDRSTMYRMQQ